MDDLTPDQLASDYEAWLKRRDRRAAKVLAGVLVLSLSILAGIGEFRQMPSNGRLIAILVIVAILTLVVIIFVSSTKKLLSNPHPLAMLVSQSDTHEAIRLHLVLTGRAKRQAQMQLYLRAAKFGDEQAYAYFKGDPWEYLPAGDAIPYDQLIAAPNVNLLATYPSWARWTLRPFLGSASILFLSTGLHGFEFFTKLSDGGRAHALVGNLSTFSLYFTVGFGAVLGLGQHMSDLQLARRPTSELIDLWLTGDHRPLAQLRRRTNKDGEAKAFMGRLA